MQIVHHRGTLSQLYLSYFPENFTLGEETSSIIFQNSGNTISLLQEILSNCFYLLRVKKEASHCDKLVLSIISPFISFLFLEVYSLTLISINISSTPPKYKTFCNFKNFFQIKSVQFHSINIYWVHYLSGIFKRYTKWIRQLQISNNLPTQIMELFLVFTCLYAYNCSC